MALGSKIPIRLDTLVEARIVKAADAMGTTKSGLLRLLADSFVAQFVDAAGRVTLPSNWMELLPHRDSRTRPVNTLNDSPPSGLAPLQQSPVNYKEAARAAAKEARRAALDSGKGNARKGGAR